MGNASMHKSIQIRTLTEKAGCNVLFLQPYSPDLKSIFGVPQKIKSEKHYQTFGRILTLLLICISRIR